MGQGSPCPTNLAQPDEVEAMVATTVDHFGRLDVLVNNAAVTFVGDLDIPLKRHEILMAINLTAPLVACHAAAPHLKAAGGGRILNVSSVAALLPIPGLMSYGISKIGLEHLTVDAGPHPPGRRHRGELLPHRPRGGVRGLHRQHARRRPVHLGAVRGRRRGCPLDAPAAGDVLRSAREHGRPPPARGDHGQPRRGRHAATAHRPPSSSTASCPTREPCSRTPTPELPSPLASTEDLLSDLRRCVLGGVDGQVGSPLLRDVSVELTPHPVVAGGVVGEVLTLRSGGDA